jgi:hypothetical protein
VEGLNADGAEAVQGDEGRKGRLNSRDDLFGNEGPLWNRFWSMHEPQREVGGLDTTFHSRYFGVKMHA